MIHVGAEWLLLLLTGLVLILMSLRWRKVAGFGAGRQVASDNVTLVSKELGLSGRPDRIVRIREHYIPEEKKSSNRVYPGHVLQLGTYFLLIEAHYGKRPPYGFIVLGDGRREKIKNTASLRQEVLDTAQAMRHSLAKPEQQLNPGHKNAAKCRSCGMAAYCEQKIC